MKKKNFQKLTALAISISLVGFFITTSMARADVASTTSSNLSSVLEQLIQLLTTQLQGLEQQLAAQQQQINTLQNVYSQSILTPTATPQVNTTDFIAKIPVQPSSAYQIGGVNHFIFDISIGSPDGQPLDGKRVEINETPYTSQNGGNISYWLSSEVESYTTPSSAIVVTDGTSTYSQTIDYYNDVKLMKRCGNMFWAMDCNVPAPGLQLCRDSGGNPYIGACPLPPTSPSTSGGQGGGKPAHA
jgi:type II secretory pathway pseudopilin PulG